jgi:protein TonB
MATAYFDWDERLFSQRNKLYGAYELRRRYVRHTTRALIFTILGVIIIFSAPVALAYVKAQIEGLNPKKKKSVITELIEPPPINKNEPPPPPVEQPPPPPQRAQIKFVPPQIVKEEQAKPEETIANIDTLMKVDPGTKNVEGDPNALPEIGEVGGTGNQPVEIDEAPPDPTAFVAVEKEPEPINMDQIRSRIGYPSFAKEAGIQGKVIVRVLVGKNGKYERHIVLKSPHNVLKEAVEKELPNLEFTPGIQAGKPIRVWVTIPFDFQLR